MNQADEMRLVADLEPALLNRLAEDGYARHRDGDLARALAAGPGRVRPPRRSPVAGTRRRGALLTGGVAATAAAAAAVAVVAQAPASRPHAPSSHAVSSPAWPSSVPTSTRGFLLASAVHAAASPAGRGTYWYVKHRDFYPTVAGSRESKHAPPKSVTRKKAAPPEKTAFGARLAYTEQSWMGENRARTITNEDVAITFVSPAAEAAWKAAGEPPLFTAYGFSNEPVTSDYHMSFHWGVGSAQLSWADLQRLSSASALDAGLRRMWSREPDKAGQFGTTSYSQYVFQWAGQLLTGPVQPAIRAATYQLLAAQPGLVTIGTVTDPEGRTGIAVSDGAGDFLIINPATAQAMAYGTGTLHQGEVITAGSVSGIEVYQDMGWSTQLGVIPPS
jgi:hypothetical protein